MKKLSLALAFLAALPLAAAAQVTKEDLKKLAAAGISDDVILSYVRANGGVARLSADDVIELKTAGASEKVLAVALGNAPAPAPAQSAPSVPQSYYTAERSYPSSTYVYDSSPYYYTPSVSYAAVSIGPVWPYYGYYGYGCYPRYYNNCYRGGYYGGYAGYCAPHYAPHYGTGYSASYYRGSAGVSSYRGGHR